MSVQNGASAGDILQSMDFDIDGRPFQAVARLDAVRRGEALQERLVAYVAFAGKRTSHEVIAEPDSLAAARAEGKEAELARFLLDRARQRYLEDPSFRLL